MADYIFREEDGTSKLTRGHDEHFRIADGGSLLLPTNGTAHGIGGYGLADGGYQMHYMGVISLASGSHTISVQHNAASSTASITWKDLKDEVAAAVLVEIEGHGRPWSRWAA